ncbi:MAG: enoyl-CoA hydratase, partial [Pseudomonadota bacterium]
GVGEGFDGAGDVGFGDAAAEIADLDATVAAIVAPYLTVSTPAVGAAKHLACDLGGGVTEADITRSVEALADAWESEDAQSRIAAFLKKRARSKS